MKITVGLAGLGLLWAWSLAGWNPTPEEQAALNRISAQSMRGHLSFLASDALEGRGTPSRGLDIAAEYIAAQFRRAGLEPAGPGGSYFQVADFTEVNQRSADSQITFHVAGESTTFRADELRLQTSDALDSKDLAAVVVGPDANGAADIAGRVVLAEVQNARRPTLAKLREGKPLLIVLVSVRPRPDSPDTQLQPADQASSAGLVILYGDKAVAMLRAARKSKEPASVSVHIAPPERKRTLLRNVAAILRGSDPALKSEFVVLSAHYDHLGMRAEGTGDRIFNGANDNGSGTVSVIEVAGALSSLPAHPKRSILFLAFFGEEEGLLGALYYTRHPLVPLAKTVVNINLEQMGRTDEQDGKQVSAFSFTGPSFSTVPKLMAEAAKAEGVRVYQKKDADSFFGRSDNYAFAQAGVVDHTVVVAYEYPDYHGLGDEWEKIDYANMERVDRAVAAGVLRLANETGPPRWLPVPATEKYRQTQSK